MVCMGQPDFMRLMGTTLPLIPVVSLGQAQGIAFAIGVPPHIYAFHCYTRNSIPLCRTQAVQSQVQFPG